MTAIYSENPGGWQLLNPTGFPDEKTLQDLVAQAPDLLPLSGTPRVVVLGREVRLGSGYLDVLGIESTGVPVLIEVKLSQNAESRRAVIAQILAYAAALHGTSVQQFETVVLGKHLGGQPLAARVWDSVQDETIDDTEFTAQLRSALRSGAFRLVLVLDQAPLELVRVAGYLEAMTHDLVIDLITVSSYEVGGRRIVVPQRVEPQRPVTADDERDDTSGGSQPQAGQYVYGLDAFRERVEQLPAEHRPVLNKMVAFAEQIRDGGLAQVGTYFGKNGDVVLNPRLLPQGSGLASLYCRADGKAAIQLWRSVFETRAPGSITAVEAAGGAPIGRGTIVTVISDELLRALLAAYEEAARSS
ncbi:hypothetical protein [Actinoplanes sp. URMC 104]|uniref:hypothetical protein n=1 Tax=Actinoplanes sp. URMC 104 TaxID=3423409 RepID=UPI003F1C7D8F